MARCQAGATPNSPGAGHSPHPTKKWGVGVERGGLALTSLLQAGNSGDLSLEERLQEWDVPSCCF